MMKKNINRFLSTMMMALLSFNACMPYYANAEGEIAIGEVSEEVFVSEDSTEERNEDTVIETHEADEDDPAEEADETDDDGVDIERPETDIETETLIYGDYEYTITNDEVTITRYTGYDTEVVIPATIDGYPVKKIGRSAFKACLVLASIEIPKWVEEIDMYAFSECCSLSSISFNTDLKKIGERAFSGCSNITSIDLPEGLEEIGTRAFQGSQMTYIKIPSTITALRVVSDADESAFTGCGKLETIEFAYGLKEVPRYGVTGIDSLKKVILPETVNKINQGAFYSNKNLISINLPDGITKIEDETFMRCGSLDSITIPQNVTEIGSNAFASCTGLTAVSFNSCIKIIGERAFSGCSNITSIDLPEGLEEIGTRAFQGSQITYIKIPSTITALRVYSDADESAFTGCGKLETIEFANGLKEVPRYGVTGIDSLKKVILPETVNKINKGAFYSNKNLTDINLPNSIKEIEAEAFICCVSLTAAIIPNQCTTIGAMAFKGCEAIKEIKIPKSVKLIASDSFWGDDKLTIYGYADSYAQSYANENNIPFVVLDDEEYENSAGFDLKKDGYSIINYFKSFGYSDTYYFSLDRYQEVFGEIFTQHIYDQKKQDWRGSCWGMAASAVLFYKGKLNLYDYIPEGTTLNDHGFDDIGTEGANDNFLRLKRDSDLTKLIERYQIWSESVEYIESANKDAYKYLSDNDIEKNSNIISIIESTSEPLILTVQWTENGKSEGHALVVDSSREIEDVGDGWKLVYLYDPNNPFYASFGSRTPRGNYRYALSRFIELNIKNGQWRMDVEVNGDSKTTQIGCDEEGNILRESFFLFTDTNGYPVNFDQKASFTASNGNANISYQSNDFSVYDYDNTLLYKKANGSTQFINKDIVYDRKMVGYTEDCDPGLDEGMLLLPEGQYMVIVESGMIAYGSKSDYLGVVTNDQPITVYNTASNSLSVSSDQSASVNIVVMDTYSSDKFTSIQTDVIVDQDGCAVSLSDNKLDIDTNDDQRFDVDIITEDGKGEIKDVSSNEVEKIDVDDYVEEIVEYSISYDLDGGQVTGNPVSYTKDTESFTLVNPVKDGYVFNGWTGSNGNIPQTTVVIGKGTEGSLSFKANWGDQTKTVTGITLSVTKLDLKKGEAGVLAATITPSDAPVTSVKWTVSNDSIASISVNGAEAKVFANNTGETVITVRTGDGIEASCIVTVYDDEALVVSENSPMNPVPVIDENTKKLHLVKGQKFTLSENGWTCADKKYLTVSKKNLVTAKKETSQPVKLTNGDRSIDVYITKPSMAKKSITMQAGSSQAIEFNYDNTNLAVLWYSSSPDIATVSEDGTVTAVGKGAATLTAYVNGSAYTCKVKVREEATVQERTLHITLNAKKTISIKGLKKVIWVSDDESIAAISKNNKLTAEAAGETMLRAEYDGREYRIKVFVEDPEILPGAIQNTGKNKYSLTLKPGEEAKIAFKSIAQPVIFKSNKGETAYVCADGTIKANRSGKAKLTAKVNGKTITINVIVKQ